MLTVKDIKLKYQNGETPVQVVEKIYETIEKDNQSPAPLNAFIHLSKELALKQADSLKETDSPLAGIPIAIKDNINITGERTTCASRILSNYEAVFDAFVIQKLKDAGAIIIGKTNMDEFAMGSSSETSFFGPVLNPVDRERVPGGSSGGSAASVSAGFVPFSLGSDTGGSIRQPAAFCGIVGFKPTYGTVSRFGLVAFASSLDQIGPFANSVEDAALLFKTIAGHDPMDSTSILNPLDFQIENIKKPIKGLRVGLVKEYRVDGLQPEIASKIDETVKRLKEMGALIQEVSLPNTQYAIPIYYIIAPAEASSNLARFDGIRYGKREEAEKLIDIYLKSRGKGFGQEVKRRIMIGTYVLSSGYYDAYYLSAQKVRTLVSQDFASAFKEVDVLLTPTSPTTAFKIGEKTSDPLQMYLSDIFTISANLAGLPAVSIPAGKDSKGLPIGIQLIGNLLEDEKILQTAYNLEQHFKK
ncbi:MAG TPA: Asp-tRNA(Asn)/Glu-tRNA(Gln) amidotransferase GatCAB subunit A [Spirochaetia bacterium]|nr:MAG: aspartyl/glutamyl-tRNA amidotransferase subunit A [Spirochaetes bacterium GWB1_36_13]HCL57183.1 Asp-tRNA(Asn)/Glu-tRNA(Gln) amidotransferase GatCAB subunit A [Spirochaetia bacterium]